jgi:serine protease Do
MNINKDLLMNRRHFHQITMTAILVLVLSIAGFAQDAPQDRTITSLSDLNQAFVDIVAQVTPAVVTVSTQRMVSMRQRSPFAGDPFFEYFFGPRRGRQGQEREYRQEGLGSGVIVSADGLILTNNHVIEGADSIFVRKHDGRRFVATVVGADPQTDIAVIKIETDNPNFLELGNSDDLQVGEIVLAIGSPMSEHLAYTVTQGIVSAKGRANVGLATYEDFIQTDAAINPGNSGGPMVSIEGKVVGINAAIASQTGGFQGIGFAIPSNMAMHVMNSLLAEGRVVRAWLGVNIQDVDAQIANAMGLEQVTGALIGDVVEGSPADAAGLVAGDIILQVGARRIDNSGMLRSAIGSSTPGETVNLDVLRTGETLQLSATLGELPDEVAEVSPGEDVSSMLGFTVQTLDERLASAYGIDEQLRGAVVTSIDRESSAYQQGLREGDLISSISRRRIRSAEEFLETIEHLADGDTVLLRINRNNQGFFIAFTL